MSQSVGWGASQWGAGPWGSGIEPLKLIDAQPLRENVVRLTFNTGVKFTGILDPNDASNAERYQIIIVAGTLPGGADPRVVTPILAAVAPVAGALGSQLDVTIDRHFSPFPSRYKVSVNQLQSFSGGLLVPGFTEREFDGLVAHRGPPRRDTTLPTRDIANPQTRSALFDPLPVTDDELILGTIPVDDNGDYAFDEGITNFKKRVFRRLLTRKGAFAHALDYGVGVPDQLKKLGRQSVRNEIAVEAESQIAEEPETEQVSAQVVADSARPGLFLLRIRVKAKVSDEPIDLNVPFAPTGV